MDLVRGLDVSRHQKTIGWAAIPDSKAFAYLGVTHWPTGEMDWEAEYNILGASKRGALVGGYQRINPLRNTPEREVALFLSRLSYLDLLGPGRLLPALDVEPVDSGRDREAEAGIDMRRWVRDLFVAWTAMAPNPRVLWYSSGSFYANKYGGMVGIPNTVRLWPAHWSGSYSNPRNPGNDPVLAEDWAGKTSYMGDAEHPALVHQYWSKGTVPGIEGPVDLNSLMPGVRLTELMQ